MSSSVVLTPAANVARAGETVGAAVKSGWTKFTAAVAAVATRAFAALGKVWGAITAAYAANPMMFYVAGAALAIGAALALIIGKCCTKTPVTGTPAPGARANSVAAPGSTGGAAVNNPPAPVTGVVANSVAAPGSTGAPAPVAAQDKTAQASSPAVTAPVAPVVDQVLSYRDVNGNVFDLRAKEQGAPQQLKLLAPLAPKAAPTVFEHQGQQYSSFEEHGRVFEPRVTGEGRVIFVAAKA